MAKKSTAKAKDPRREEIVKWCEGMGLRDYEITNDYKINTRRFTDLRGKVRGSLPLYIQFGTCFEEPMWHTTEFDISQCQLTTLRGCPERVEGTFRCDKNKLKTLEHGPKYVKHGYFCMENSCEFLESDVEEFCVVDGIIKTYPGSRFLVEEYSTDEEMRRARKAKKQDKKVK